MVGLETSNNNSIVLVVILAIMVIVLALILMRKVYSSIINCSWSWSWSCPDPDTEGVHQQPGQEGVCQVQGADDRQVGLRGEPDIRASHVKRRSQLRQCSNS